MLSLFTPFDVQVELSQFIQLTRKSKKMSVKRLSQKAGVPGSTIRKFESTGEISLRQFIMLYAELGKLGDVQQLTVSAQAPRDLDEVLKHAQA
jgi:transcriptional regulator with XRE-family HTH domain